MVCRRQNNLIKHGILESANLNKFVDNMIGTIQPRLKSGLDQTTKTGLMYYYGRNLGKCRAAVYESILSSKEKKHWVQMKFPLFNRKKNK